MIAQVRPKEVAELESNCQKVVVQAGGSHEAWWTVEPRYKVQHTGEAVGYLDSISLMSEKLPGQRLRCSSVPTRDPALEDVSGKREGKRVSVHEVIRLADGVTVTVTLAKNVTVTMAITRP